MANFNKLVLYKTTESHRNFDGIGLLVGESDGIATLVDRIYVFNKDEKVTHAYECRMGYDMNLITPVTTNESSLEFFCKYYRDYVNSFPGNALGNQGISEILKMLLKQSNRYKRLYINSFKTTTV